MGNNIIREEEMKQWDNPRLFYLKTIINPIPTTCPECGGELNTREDEYETICTTCGLVTSASIEYCAGIKIHLPYGRR